MQIHSSCCSALEVEGTYTYHGIIVLRGTPTDIEAIVQTSSAHGKISSLCQLRLAALLLTLSNWGQFFYYFFIIFIIFSHFLTLGFSWLSNKYSIVVEIRSTHSLLSHKCTSDSIFHSFIHWYFLSIFLSFFLQNKTNHQRKEMTQKREHVNIILLIIIYSVTKFLPS
jgi:hypothetical protein